MGRDRSIRELVILIWLLGMIVAILLCVKAKSNEQKRQVAEEGAAEFVQEIDESEESEVIESEPSVLDEYMEHPKVIETTYAPDEYSGFGDCGFAHIVILNIDTFEFRSDIETIENMLEALNVWYNNDPENNVLPESACVDYKYSSKNNEYVRMFLTTEDKEYVIILYDNHKFKVKVRDNENGLDYSAARYLKSVKPVLEETEQD